MARLAVSMDGASAATHDAFRGMRGSFARTLDAVRWANEAGLPVQINTTFSRRNIGEIDAIVALMESMRITLWSVFFLVPTGRGKINDLLSADEFEEVFAKIYRLSETASFDIKTTEAQHYRRYLLQQHAAERRMGTVIEAPEKLPDTIGRAPRGLNDGKGFVFISHTGEVFPSGFLPASAGNIRNQPLAQIYRGLRSFRRFAILPCSKASAARANSSRFVAAPVLAPTRSPAIPLVKSPAALMFLRDMFLHLPA